MSLSSPRFVGSERLRAAAENRPPLRKGASGRGVHLVQFALLDLGHTMPNSTGGGASPDGLFGDETEEVIKSFQRDQRNPRLTDDGVVGRETMRALDRAFRQHSHRVRLHFISISLTNVQFDDLFRNTRRVFSQYGIGMEFSSGRSLLLTDEQSRIFDRIDQNCNWTLSTGEYNQLHSLGPNVPSNELQVYFVNRMRGALGCGGHAPGRPAATVARQAWRWDVAHEVGHVLLTSSYSPVHHPHPRNLMNAFPANNNVVKILTDDQVRQIRRHSCCIALR